MTLARDAVEARSHSRLGDIVHVRTRLLRCITKQNALNGRSPDWALHAPDQGVTLSFIELLTAGAAGIIL
jgi:hypothetical protein